MIENWLEKLHSFLELWVGCPIVIAELKQLAGGAIQENWAIDVSIESGRLAGFHQLVIRFDAASSVQVSHSRSEEFAIMRVARKAGVMMPKPCLYCDDKSVLGRSFFLMDRLEGISAGYRLVKNAQNPRLLYQLGENLAYIHSIKPPQKKLSFLPNNYGNPAKMAIKLYRDFLNRLHDSHPVIEWGLSWLELNAPLRDEVVLCHRDFRTGNFMVDEDNLTGVLDWEMAGWSDPHEDIFWFTSKCWRFGTTNRPAGGLGQREDFYRGYEENSSRRIKRDQQVYWEVMAHVRWATIACQQAERHISGGESSIELALTGHIVPELELEILNLIKET